MTGISFESIGWVLVHSVWQFALLAVLAGVVQRIMRPASAAARYGMLLAFLMLMACCPVITWYEMPRASDRQDVVLPAVREEAHSWSASSRPVEDIVSGPLQTGIAEANPSERVVSQPTPHVSAPQNLLGLFRRWLESLSAVLKPCLSWISAGWLLGVVVLSARLAAGWRRIEILKKSRVRPADAVTDSLLQQVAGKLQVRRSVTLLISEAVTSPVVVGCVRSVILLPATLLSAVPTSQVEAILAHELAHVRRYDYVVNLMQSLAETLFFYHPAVWWLSSRIRVEREHCCDDIVVAALNNRNEYGRALMTLEERRTLSAGLAVGAGEGHLLARIRRIVAMRDESARVGGGGLAIAAAVMTLVVAVTCSFGAFADADGLNQTKKPSVGLVAEHSADETDDAEPTTASPEEKEVATGDAVEAPKSDSDKTSFQGRIVLPDGSPSNVNGWMYYNAKTNGGGYFGTVGSFIDRFEFSGPAGEGFIEYFPDGYAPVWTPKMQTRGGDQKEGFTLKLTNGIDAEVQVRDASGAPVENATVVALPVIHGSSNGPVIPHGVDLSGNVTLQHLADVPYEFRVTASGFEPLRTESLQVTSDAPIVLTMTEATPTTGIIVNADGTPAAAAKLRALLVVNATSSNDQFADEGDGFYGKVLATADDQGRFMLDSLTDGSRYLFIIEGADGTRLLDRSLLAGQSDVQIQLPARRDLAIELRGSLNDFFRDGDRHYLNIRQSVALKTDRGSWGDLVGGRVEISPNATGGTILYRGLVIDPEVDFSDQVAEVLLGTKKRVSQKLQLSEQAVTSHTWKVGPIPQVSIDFPKAQTSRLEFTDGRESGLMFHSGDHVHAVLIHQGFLQTGLSYSDWGDIQNQHLKWRFNGKIKARSGGRKQVDGKTQWERERTYALSLEFSPPDLEFKLDGQTYDLQQGRIFVLMPQGNPIQLNLDPPSLGEEDDEAALDRFGKEVESALKQREASKESASGNNAWWSAFGQVTDENGHPLEGVTIRASTGIGSLRGGGTTQTDAEGRYDLKFGPGILFGDAADQEPPSQTQYALIFASLDGHFEKNFCRQGNGIASLKPVPDDELKEWGVDADQICLPDHPREVNFVMLPAASVSGTLVDENNVALEDYSVSLIAEKLPPGSSVLAQVRTNEQGRFEITQIPTTQPYQFVVRKPDDQLKPPWDDSWASGPITFLDPGDADFATTIRSAQAYIDRVTVDDFRIRIEGPGVHDKQAVKTSQKQQPAFVGAGLNAESLELKEHTLVLSNSPVE